MTVSALFRTTVGSKSLNLAKLRSSLPPDIVTPQGVALPFGCFQKTLNSPENKKLFTPLTECLSELKPYTPNLDADRVFRKARGLISQLEFPSAFQAEWNSLMEDSTESIDRIKSLYEACGAPAAWNAVVSVWASLFGLRPWVSESVSLLFATEKEQL